ncbi:MAG TPA: HAD-IA family hydrolase [Candidatus Saccharimonadales bacterium]|nr:HAD-IA family hydrolase [Candidatus Saccharimonadales bacterium]
MSAAPKTEPELEPRIEPKIKLICWDLDGTLTDSVRFVVDTANAVIGRHGGRLLEFDEVGRMTGLPLESIFRLAWPDLSDEDAIAYRTEYREVYSRVVVPATKLFRGAASTVRAFHRAGLLQATVTGKLAADCERILAGLGIRRQIQLYLGGDSVPAGRTKPAPDVTLLAMERLGARPEETVVVGDTITDMAMGRAAGVRTIQVLWGYAKEPLPEADLVVRTWPELRARILR